MASSNSTLSTLSIVPQSGEEWCNISPPVVVDSLILVIYMIGSKVSLFDAFLRSVSLRSSWQGDVWNSLSPIFHLLAIIMAGCPECTFVTNRPYRSTFTEALKRKRRLRGPVRSCLWRCYAELQRGITVHAGKQTCPAVLIWSHTWTKLLGIACLEPSVSQEAMGIATSMHFDLVRNYPFSMWNQRAIIITCCPTGFRSVIDLLDNFETFNGGL